MKFSSNVILSLAFFITASATPAFSQVGGTCYQASLAGCESAGQPSCRLTPGPCEARTRCINTYVNQCLAARTATATYYVKYNTAGADYNFLEVSNLSKTDNLVGAYRIYNTEGERIGTPVEFDIDDRGRMDFDIHSKVGPQVYGQLEISIYSDNIATSVYSSFYNQRTVPTATGVFLDQTVTVKGEQAPN